MSLSTAASYYASSDVQDRLREYCGGSSAAPPTAAFIAAVCADDSPPVAWGTARRLPIAQLAEVTDAGCDIARSLWDTRSLIFAIELDYENPDLPAEPFVHPADVFLKLEPAYRATRAAFARHGMTPEVTMTGRGYHFTGQILLSHPVTDALADLAPHVPVWFTGVERRRPAGVTASMTARQARAWAGLGQLVEFMGHEILSRSHRSDLPVVINGTLVGRAGLVGREAVSIDFSHVGDPLDVRHIRMAFGTYQLHRLRPDIFGGAAAAGVPTMVAVPRAGGSVLSTIAVGHDLTSAARAAHTAHVTLPDLSSGIERVLAAYRPSPLAQFHRAFADELETVAEAPPVRIDRLPPCVAAALVAPNDRLLKPEYLQHVVRTLLARRVSAAQIARIIESAYRADHRWGDRWHRQMDARTRAEFEVRVFAGLVATGADSLIDFNCVSAQEKDMCPRGDCYYDLRIDRDRLAVRVS